MPYFLFLLTTATLFVRPAEIFPAVSAWPIYEYLILACLAVSLPGVLKQLSANSLYENPVTACVVGLWFAVVLSHMAHFATYEARMAAFLFFKILVYYLLLVANVNSEQRLKSFLRWLLVLIALLAVLALLAAHHMIELPGIKFLHQIESDKATGELIDTPRLQSTGLFNDPNDLAMILVTGVVIALCFAADPATGILRPLMLPLIGLLGYAICATKSRGGFLALMAALSVLCHARWGWKRTVLAAVIVLPVLLVVFKGRMTSFNDAMEGEGTARARVELWSDGLQAFKAQPIFGIGQGKYEEEAGQVAHNSFVHAFTELGFFGGALFLGTFVAALIMFYRLRRGQGAGSREQGAGTLPTSFGRGAGGEGVAGGEGTLPPNLGRLLPYVTAMLVGFAVSMYSLSRNYVAPTYVMLGLATAFVQIAAGQTQAPPLRFDAWFLKRLAVASVGFLAVIYAFIRVAAR